MITNLYLMMTNHYIIMTHLYLITNLYLMITNLYLMITNLYLMVTNLYLMMKNLYHMMTNVHFIMTLTKEMTDQLLIKLLQLKFRQILAWNKAGLVNMHLAWIFRAIWYTCILEHRPDPMIIPANLCLNWLSSFTEEYF